MMAGMVIILRQQDIGDRLNNFVRGQPPFYLPNSLLTILGGIQSFG